MDYTLPKVNVKHTSKSEPYDGDFSTLFIVFSQSVTLSKPILLTKKHEFEKIEVLTLDPFLKKAVDIFFANDGDRLYIIFFYVANTKRFNTLTFSSFLEKEIDRLNDIEVISAINLFDITIYQKLLTMRQIIEIQRIINDYCAKSNRISISDMHRDYPKESLNYIGKTVFYYPWIIDSSNNTLPASIYASALFSSMAKKNRYFESIANKSIYNSQDVEFRFDDYELDLLTQEGINPVIYMPHRGVRFWGVKSFGEKLDSVNELRVMKFIKRRLLKTAKIYLFEPNSVILEAQLILLLKVFFDKMLDIGALEQYKVETDTTSLQEGNEIIINIAIAFSTPIEYINIQVSRADRDGMLSIK